jgi:hypothetical protein
MDQVRVTYILPKGGNKTPKKTNTKKLKHNTTSFAPEKTGPEYTSNPERTNTEKGKCRRRRKDIAEKRYRLIRKAPKNQQWPLKNNQKNPNTTLPKNEGTKTPRDAPSPPQKNPTANKKNWTKAQIIHQDITHQQSNRQIQSIKVQRSHRKLNKAG